VLQGSGQATCRFGAENIGGHDQRVVPAAVLEVEHGNSGIVDEDVVRREVAAGQAPLLIWHRLVDLLGGQPAERLLDQTLDCRLSALASASRCSLLRMAAT
jgi:hypothetical protein